MKQINAFGGNATKSYRNSDLTYDQRFKQLFIKKEFLTPILKNIVPEYKDCTLEQIEGLICPSETEVINPRVYDTEDTGKGDETVNHYDVLVRCKLPQQERAVGVWVFFDLEMQRENSLRYPIGKRGVYYCCRLISRQIEKLGEESYNQVRPVYSVWILTNGIPKSLQNSIYTAGLSGSFSDDRIDASEINKQIDLINLCLIYLSENFSVTEDANDLIKYLISVFTRQVDNAGCNPYNEYSKKIKEEVDEVMTLEERAIEKGRMEGEIKGCLELLIKMKQPESKIIQYLTSMEDNPLTEDQAKEALEAYKSSNGIKDKL